MNAGAWYVSVAALPFLLAGCRGTHGQGDAGADATVGDAARADVSGTDRCAEGETPCLHRGGPPNDTRCCDPDSICCYLGIYTAEGGPGSVCYSKDVGCPPQRSCPGGVSCPILPHVLCLYVVWDSSTGDISGFCREGDCGSYGIPCGEGICCATASLLCLDGGCGLKVP